MADAILLGLTIVTTASLVVLGCLAVFAGVSRGGPQPEISMGLSDQDAVFLFREDALLDCSDQARKLLEMLDERGRAFRKSAAWIRLRAYLDPRFPDLQDALDGLVGTGQAELHSVTGDGLILGLRYNQGLTYLRLTDTQIEGALVAIDRLSFDALQDELRTLRHVARNAPAIVWKTEADGRVIWANSAYLKTLHQIMPDDRELTWPLPELFCKDESLGTERLALRQDEVVRWFAHSEVECEGQILHFAVPIDATIQSEVARRETLQTLTRTFACLPIGLALFDAERRLQVFNPALIDLTGLEPLFLAARPSFEQVLYVLREKRMLPEPKDFQNWRREIIEMEKAAESGEYAEEWCLDGGRLFYVTGRPQPNGAIALFIEDVTTEAALARNFRNEIETAQNVLDALADGIVVFGLAGQVLLANEGYTQLWKTDPCADLADGGLAQALAQWSDNCTPTTFWARLAEFVTRSDALEEITGSAALRTGIPLALRARRLAGGAVMVMFQPLAQGLLSHRSEVGLHGDLMRKPDLAAQSSGEVTNPAASESAKQLLSPRKARIARHSGSRLRV